MSPGRVLKYSGSLTYPTRGVVALLLAVRFARPDVRGLRERGLNPLGDSPCSTSVDIDVHFGVGATG